MIALALTILLATDTIATSPHTIDEVVVVAAAGEGRKRSAKGQVASIDEHLAELSHVNLVRRGSYAWEPVVNNMQTERVTTTIDGMKIFYACTDKMDPVTSYVESSNLQSILLNSGLNGNPQSTGNIGGSLDLKLRKAGFSPLPTSPKGEESHSVGSSPLGGIRGGLSSGYETNGHLQVYGADASFSTQRFYTNGGAFYRHADNYREGGGRKVEFSQFRKVNVFANAVVYISKFAGHHVIARKLFEGISTDIDIKENANRVKKSTWEDYRKEIETMNLAYAHYADSIKAAHPDGKYSKSDEQILMMASHPEQVPSYEDFVAQSVGPLYAKYGTDEAAYAKYYAEHAPYFYGSLNDYGLALDSDAMNLGIKVGDLKLLDKAIRLWEHGDNVDMAKRILYHYTLLRYDNAKAFRDWYKKYSKKIFFTQSGGWLYLVNDLDPQTPGNDYSVLHYNDLEEDKPALGAESTKDDPLVLSARIDPDEYQEDIYDLVVRIKLYPGFHIYDVVSDQDPYIVNEYHTTFTGNYKTVGPLQKPNGNRLGSTGTIVFSGDNIFHQKIQGTGAGKVTFHIRYQACDDHACLMPTEKTVTVEIPDKRGER